MRRVAAVLFPLMLAGSAWGQEVCHREHPTQAGNHGTQVFFEATPQEALEKAAREGKLVMLLHLSGYFDREEDT